MTSGVEDPNEAVDVLLSTHNGERYLCEQLDSIVTQSYRPINILVRDDGSSDTTLAILEAYQAQYPELFSCFAGDNLGIVKSYNYLLGQSLSPYILFADQDDSWEPGKIERMVSVLSELAKSTSGNVPALVYSDMTCVDATGNIVADSFWNLHGVNCEHNSLPQLLIQNVVSGAAVCFNRELLEQATPVDEGARLHDWWMALHASALGRIAPISDRLVRYRIHDQNVVGANSINLPRMLNVIRSPREIQCRIDQIIDDCTRQATAFLNKNRQLLSSEDIELVEGFAAIRELSTWKRRQFLVRHGILFSSTVRNLLLGLCWR